MRYERSTGRSRTLNISRLADSELTRETVKNSLERSLLRRSEGVSRCEEAAGVEAAARSHRRAYTGSPQACLLGDQEWRPVAGDRNATGLHANGRPPLSLRIRDGSSVMVLCEV